MINIQSPFIQEIPECKLIMRRLRKKISKYTSTHKQAKKPRDQSQDILNILKSRTLPSFVLDAIKKRRTFDLLCLKSVVLNGESSLQEMVKLAGSQQAQIQGMFAEHKTRIRKHHSRTAPKLQRRSTNCSSTQQDDSCQNISEFNSGSQFENKQNSFEKEINTENHEIIQQNSFHQDEPIFHGRDFLQFQGDMYSQEEWLKF